MLLHLSEKEALCFASVCLFGCLSVCLCEGMYQSENYKSYTYDQGVVGKVFKNEDQMNYKITHHTYKNSPLEVKIRFFFSNVVMMGIIRLVLKNATILCTEFYRCGASGVLLNFSVF